MALYEEFAPRPNRLIDAQSAYLRSAAYQPVGWYEYGAEAFAEARRQNKPILLDIGAVWCHWCHVIDRESYEDPEIATLLNELFIPVKVDRDERPDIDVRYQAAVQLLTGQGGWPLTVFLTPDGEPFYGGTFFPPEDRQGRVGLKALLPKISDTYRNQRRQLGEIARELTERTSHALSTSVEHGQLTEQVFGQIAHGIETRFNPDHGGFEVSGPKFPHAGAIELALLQYDRTGDARWRTIVEKTLTAMGHGGIYDQLGGGFHRYATDATWRVPHFEKMGYDNALLLASYVHAYRATGYPFMRTIAEGTLDFIRHDLTDQRRGGFYSSQDADISEHDDGNYWTWTFDELADVLLPDDLPVLLRYYGIRRKPETGRNVLHVSEPPEEIATALDMPIEEVTARIDKGKRTLMEVRRHRKAPRIDTTKYANVNALLISALIEAGTLLEDEEASAIALRAADVLVADAYEPEHGIYHGFHGEHGAWLPGLLEDQVYAAQALLDAFQVNGKRNLLEVARHLLDLCIERYWDDAAGGFMDTARTSEDTAQTPFMLQVRKGIEDMPTPAPNAIAALVLDRLWLLTRDERYHTFAQRTLESFVKHAPGHGPLAAYYGLAVYYHLHAPGMAVIVGSADDDRTQALWHAALATYRPGRLVVASPPDAPILPYAPGSENRAVAYVCAGEACAEPTSDPGILQARLREFGKV